jgi:hypothetical protein
VSTALDGIADRGFVTWLARITKDPEFVALLPWWRRQCAERALEAMAREYDSDADAAQLMGRAGGDLGAVGRLVLAMQNEVETKQELIDGRTTRHAAGGPTTTGRTRARR